MLCIADGGADLHNGVDALRVDLVTDCCQLGADVTVHFYVDSFHVKSIPVELSGFGCATFGRLYRSGRMLVPHPNALSGGFLVECENNVQSYCKCTFMQVGRRVFRCLCFPILITAQSQEYEETAVAWFSLASQDDLSQSSGFFFGSRWSPSIQNATAEE